jgi:hypothetical protein
MKISLIKNSPFTLFSIEELFSESLLLSLSEEFPSDKLFEHQDLANGKRYGDHTQNVFDKYISDNSSFQEFYKQITSYEIVSQILNSLSDTAELKFLNICKSSIIRKSSCDYLIYSKSRFGKRFKLRIGYEFSSMQNGSHLFPHTDSASKLLSILIFLPLKSDFGNNLDVNVGTKFWKSKSNEVVFPNWNSVSLNAFELEQFYENHECFIQLPFTATQHYGFCKSEVSWHSVPTVPDGFHRKSINITFWISETRRKKRLSLGNQGV